LFAGPARIEAEVVRALDSFAARGQGGRHGHVFNLGHGISQHTPPESVEVLVETVHSHSRRPLVQA